MKEKKNCIFHLPFTPDPVNHPSGTNIRPAKMLQGFKDLGYEVFEIVGSSQERVKQIRDLKRLIQSGINFEFVYSESETTPTILTDSDHIPRHPFADFGFLSYCRRNGIPVGLFYRDAYWRSEEYRRITRGFKGLLLEQLYEYDLWQYKRSVDVLFVPSLSFTSLVLPDLTGMHFQVLPAGCGDRWGDPESSSHNSKDPSAHPLRLIYVGGISVGEAYDLTMLFETVYSLENVEMIVCVREDDWNHVSGHYKDFVGDKIKIRHLSGEELDPLLAEADMGIMFFAPSPYRSLCMPSKLFEYLEKGLPIIALAETASGDFVQDQGIGVCCPYSKSELRQLLTDMRDNRGDVKKMREKCISRRAENTWKMRAEVVEKVLGSVKFAHSAR